MTSIDERDAAKRLMDTALFLGSLFLVGGCLLMAFGCGSATTPTVQTTCFATVDGISRTVDIGMNVTGDLYRAGKIPEPTKAQIVKIFDTQYKPAITAAGYGCKAVQDQGSLDKVLADVKGGVKAILEAIAGFGGK